MRKLAEYFAGLAVFALGLHFSLTAHANVYATNIKLNGSLSNIVTSANGNVAISYILNEPATSGVTLNINSGANVIRTIQIASGQPGALTGSNSVVWNETDDAGHAVPLGAYKVSITAAATGYTTWTQISLDTNPGHYVFDPRGIAVDDNTNSPYYGRVLVGNAAHGPNAATVPGDNDTILKMNADGSFADEGPDGNGGYPIFDDGNDDLPQKMRVSDDDRLYMNDWTATGQIVAFDVLLTTNQVVLTQNNYSSNPFWPDPLEYEDGWFSIDVTSAGTTNGLVWLGEVDPNAAGIWFWHLTNGVADPNDTTGTQAISVGGTLTVAASGGMMIDTNLDIFVSQDFTDPGDSGPVCMDFTNWNNGKTSGGAAEANGAAWAVGAGDSTFQSVYDTTIDSRLQPKYVACAMTNGGIRILNATNGTTLVPALDNANSYFVTAWDNVGNLYGASGSLHLWRVFSPPSGANQSTTVATATINLSAGPAFTGISVSGGNVILTFQASSSYSTNSFTLLSSPVVQGPYTTVSGAVITEVSSGTFQATTSRPATTQFYSISASSTH